MSVQRRKEIGRGQTSAEHSCHHSSESPEAISTMALTVHAPRLSEQAVNVRLGNIELRESVMSNLLECTLRRTATTANTLTNASRSNSLLHVPDHLDLFQRS